MKKLSIFMIIIIIIDRILKIVFSNIGSINVIGNFFKITLLHNYGAAWSILNGYRLFLIAITILELFIIYIIFIKNKKLSTKESIVLGTLTGGIVGNLIDRLIYGYVIDYLDFNIFGYNFPVFNFADAAIVISIIIIIFLIYKGDLDDSRKRL